MRQDFGHQGATPTRTIWTGSFDTWERASDSAAASFLQVGADCFSSARWLTRQKEMLQAARDGKVPRPTALPSLHDWVRSTEIWDLGGGSGWVFRTLEHFSESTLPTYTVIEKSSVAQEFDATFRDESRVAFQDLQQLKSSGARTTGVVYSNSAIQYMPDNSDLLRLIRSVRPQLVLLDDVQTSTMGEFFSLQHYYGSEIPTRFLEVRQLKELLRIEGFELIAEVDYPASFGGPLEPMVSGIPAGRATRGVPCSMLFALQGVGGPEVAEFTLTFVGE